MSSSFYCWSSRDKEDGWQWGKVRLTRKTVKEGPVAKECWDRSCDGYRSLEGQNIFGSQLGQICIQGTCLETFLVVTLEVGEWKPGMLQTSYNGCESPLSQRRIQPKLQERIGKDIFQLPARTPGAPLRFSSCVYLCMYLFLAALGLHCCVWAFPSCDKWVLLSGCGAQASHCSGFASRVLQELQHRSSVVAAHGLRCLAACGIFLDQGWDSCPPHWQANSWPPDHQGSPTCLRFIIPDIFTLSAF